MTAPMNPLRRLSKVRPPVEAAAGTPAERPFLGTAEMPHTAVDRVAPELFVEATGKSGRGRRMAQRFLRHVSRTDLDDSISDSAREDALDASYVLSAVETALSSI